MSPLVRITFMLATMAGGVVWVAPRDNAHTDLAVRFVERAEASGCQNAHSMCRLSPLFDNIMPWLTSVGAAAAAADYDNDGFADLYVTNSGSGQSNRLFHNRGNGTFEDVTDRAGVGCGNERGACMHAIWGDVDGDTDLDLYVVKWSANNSLFINDGMGRFTEGAAKAGVDYWGNGNGATFLDYDRDGRLDLLLGNYFADQILDPKTGQRVRNDLWNPVSTKIMHETFTHARNGGTNVLYRNRGDGTFEDVSRKVGLAKGGWTLAVGSGDLNNDGWPDLYIANDFGPDEFYLNTGATQSEPAFRLVIDPKGHPGVGNDWWKGMNVDMGDVNNDGYLDIYVTNILSRKYKTDEGNMLWINCADAECPGGRGFRNVAEPAGVIDGGWGWGGKFADFNNDGLLDIFTVNGFVTGSEEKTYWYHIQEMVTQTKNQTVDTRDWPVMGDRDLSGRELSRLFIQEPPRAGSRSAIQLVSTSAVKGTTEAPRFVECAEASGVVDTLNGRGIAVADFNLDGRQDFYIANQGMNSTFYVNETVLTGGRGFLRLNLVGRPDLAVPIGNRRLASTTNAVGARVRLVAANTVQTREVQGGMGYSSQSEFPIHFGVSDAAAVQQIVIRWPSGRVQEFEGEAARRLINHHVRIVENAEPVIVK